MMLSLLLLAAVPAAATPPKSCEQRTAEMSDRINAVVANLAGLSEQGRQILLQARRDQGQRLWCDVRSPSDIARANLLSALAADEVNPAEVARARQAELEAIARAEAAELDQLVDTMARLPAEDRRKLAAFMLRDLRESWDKRARNEAAGPDPGASALRQ